mmetsp:Transcript_16374/g.49444  ORF Transcript_16374/g.49444 Transcript_16374/m.49444 type:complete len:323 (+) Transcript_16374:523-1491(+)
MRHRARHARGRQRRSSTAGVHRVGGLPRSLRPAACHGPAGAAGRAPGDAASAARPGRLVHRPVAARKRRDDAQCRAHDRCSALDHLDAAAGYRAGDCGERRQQRRLRRGRAAGALEPREAKGAALEGRLERLRRCRPAASVAPGCQGRAGARRPGGPPGGRDEEFRAEAQELGRHGRAEVRCLGCDIFQRRGRRGAAGAGAHRRHRRGRLVDRHRHPWVDVTEVQPEAGPRQADRAPEQADSLPLPPGAPGATHLRCLQPERVRGGCGLPLRGSDSRLPQPLPRALLEELSRLLRGAARTLRQLHHCHLDGRAGRVAGASYQ